MLVCKTARRWYWAQILDCDLWFKKDLCGWTQDLPGVTHQTVVYCLADLLSFSLTHRATEKTDVEFWLPPQQELNLAMERSHECVQVLIWPLTSLPGCFFLEFWESLAGQCSRTALHERKGGRSSSFSSPPPLPLSCRKIAEGTSDIREKIRLFK